MNRLKHIKSISLLLLLFLIGWLSFLTSYRYLLNREEAFLSHQLSLFSSDLESEIGKFAFLPRVLARNEKFQLLLGSKPDQARVASVNQDLDVVNRAANTEVIYIMQLEGTTIAASNWEAEDSFIGGNFIFRPYFKNAIAGKEGRYFALGTTSKRRGYYFSSPVLGADKLPIGVIVVKVDIDKLESSWADYQTTYLVTDNNGVVFSSNKALWKYRTLKHLSEAAIKEIALDQQYPPDILIPTPFDQNPDHAELVTTVLEDKQQQFLSVRQFIPSLNWHIYALLPAVQLRNLAGLYALLATMLVGLSIALLFLALARRRNLHEKLELKQRSERQLKDAHDKLEQRVAERTQALSENNQILEREIIDRCAAERELRQTQKELIHAARLATLGQLASGVSHELNQPLAAIASYAENAKQFLDRQQAKKTQGNLDEILKLTDRMNNITTQLRTFSRKADPETSSTNSLKCIHNAFALIQPRIKLSGTEVTLNLLEQARVIANPIRLEQVLINLISNALDAMEDAPMMHITLDQSQDEKWIVTRVVDSGAGIGDDRLPHIFDAFYTTKSVGVGLGLGLSISSDIIQSFGGKLTARNHPDGGAEFEIKLKKAL